MRVLQSGHVGPEVLAELRKLVGALKMRRILDETITVEILALLEQWAMTTDPALRLEALQWGATLTEDGETRCRLLKGAGETMLANYGEVDSAITLYEQALDAEVDLELMVDLGNLYDTRGADGDKEQAAALYAALGDFLGDEDGIDFLATALDLVPGHTEALDALEQLIPEERHATELAGRWRAYLESSTDEEGRAKCTMSLAKLQAADGNLEQALEMLDPLVKADNDDAKTLRHELIVSSDASGPAQPSAAPGVLSAVGRAILDPSAAPVDAAAADAGVRSDPTPTDVSAPPVHDPDGPPIEDLDGGGFEDAATYVMDAAPGATHAQPGLAAPVSHPAPAAEPAMLIQTHTPQSTPELGAAEPLAKSKRSFGWLWIVAGLAMIGLAVGGGLWVVEQQKPAAAVPPAPAPPPAAPLPVAAEPTPEPAAAPEPAADPKPTPTPDAGTGARPEASPTEPEAAAEQEPEAATEQEPPASKRTDIDVHIAMEHSRLRGGKLDREALERSLSSIRGELEACYDEAIGRRPRLRGRLVMQWNVRRNGKVSGLRKVRSSLQDARLHRCAKTTIQGVTFDKPRRKPAKVRMPFDFTQPRGGGK